MINQSIITLLKADQMWRISGFEHGTFELADAVVVQFYLSVIFNILILLFADEVNKLQVVFK